MKKPEDQRDVLVTVKEKGGTISSQHYYIASYQEDGWYFLMPPGQGYVKKEKHYKITSWKELEDLL